ncbi:GntR family transcriptional regulator [Candidimonas nitroreducens]|nr:GntR family transcriptional regulator [Candidimonas nitroreducens]
METVEEITLEEASDISRSDMAHRTLMKMLLAGELEPNEVLTERQIALRLGMSRTPVREAVRRLEGERLLERQRSGALVVRALPVEEFMHILAVRRLLEGEAASRAAGKIPAAKLEVLMTRIEGILALPEDVITPDPTDGVDLHMLIVNACGNPVLQQMIADLRTRTAMFRLGRLPMRRHAVCAEHLAIIEAIMQGDAERARQAMQHHIDQVRVTILARLGEK